jgi:hypothetical protein
MKIFSLTMAQPETKFILERLEFEAKTTLLDNVNRVANNLVFGAALYGVYTRYSSK